MLRRDVGRLLFFTQHLLRFRICFRLRLRRRFQLRKFGCLRRRRLICGNPFFLCARQLTLRRLPRFPCETARDICLLRAQLITLFRLPRFFFQRR